MPMSFTFFFPLRFLAISVHICKLVLEVFGGYPNVNSYSYLIIIDVSMIVIIDIFIFRNLKKFLLQRE